MAHENLRPQRAPGKIIDIKKGATTAHVRIDVNGTIVTASSPMRLSTISASRSATRSSTPSSRRRT